MIRLNVRTPALETGIENASQLARYLGCSFNTAYGLWSEDITRIEFATLDKLCELFRCGIEVILIKEAKHGKGHKTRKGKG